METIRVVIICIIIAIILYDKLEERKLRKDMRTLRKLISGRYDELDTKFNSVILNGKDKANSFYFRRRFNHRSAFRWFGIIALFDICNKYFVLPTPMDIVIICLLVLFVIVCLVSVILIWITADKDDLQWMKKYDSLQWLYNFIMNMRDDENVDNN